MKLIDKSALVAEIGDLVNIYKKCPTRNSYEDGLKEGRLIGYKDALHKIDTLEVKEVNFFWHKQSEEDIDNSFNDWGLHRFICLMKDGSIQKFTAIRDECYDGSINLHLDCVDDEYEWEYDDIIYWIEVPNIKVQKGE